MTRNLEPEQIIDVDVSVNDFNYDQKEGCFLYIGTGGTLVVQLIGDNAWHTFANIPDAYECRMAVKAVRSTTTCEDILALV